MPRHLVPYNQSAQGRRNHAVRAGAPGYFRELSADLRGNSGMLEQQRALKKLATVEAGAEQKVALEKGSGLFEELYHV